MKICPALAGYEKYSKFFACALHTDSEKNKKKLFKDKTFLEKTKRQLHVFLEKYEFSDNHKDYTTCQQ